MECQYSLRASGGDHSEHRRYFEWQRVNSLLGSTVGVAGGNAQLWVDNAASNDSITLSNNGTITGRVAEVGADPAMCGRCRRLRLRRVRAAIWRRIGMGRQLVWRDEWLRRW